MNKQKELQKYTEPKLASILLNTALEYGGIPAVLLTLRAIAIANGGLGKLAKKTKLNRQNLYRSLSTNGNPRIKTVKTILNHLGLRLSFAHLHPKAAA